MAPLSEAGTFNKCWAESDGTRLIMKFYMTTSSQRFFSQTTRRERRVEPTAAACTSRPSAWRRMRSLCCLCMCGMRNRRSGDGMRRCDMCTLGPLRENKDWNRLLVFVNLIGCCAP